MRPSHARFALLGAIALLSFAPSLQAAPVVPGFERFGRSGASPAPAGDLLLGELNCVLCHSAKGTPAKQGPVLDKVGERVRVAYLRKFLRDPQETKPGTAMPNLFVDDPKRDAKVEALVHFLASTGRTRPERSDAKAVNTGHDLFDRVGCVACHGPRDAKGEAEKTAATHVPLVDLKGKYTIASLAAFLENPQQARPSGRMPGLLTMVDVKERKKEAHELANYLIQGVKVAAAPTGTGAAKYAYYEGKWDALPDFTKLKPIATGVGKAFDLAEARRHTEYALVFEGVFRIDQPGTYTFHTSSDDGSRLYVDDKQVVDNDGIHPQKEASGKIELKKGVHAVRVAFFQEGGGDALEVEVDGAGLARQNLAGLTAVDEAALQKAPTPAANPDDFTLDPALVKEGKELFASTGCANCHTLQKIKSTLPARALANVEGGCLGAKKPGVPWYDLDDAQKKTLAAALGHPDVDKTPTAVISRTMLAFNCYACHSRDKIGGPEEELKKHFETTQPEMGDEAKTPPPLDGVGGKLRPAYFKNLLNVGAHDRPYMLTRMPAFGTAALGPIQAALTEVDSPKFPPVPEVKFDETIAKVKGIGRHMTGDKAFGCIKCHTFAGNKAEGVQGIDMTLMTTRLNRDWFFAYLADPSKIRPGTRMPSIFDKGKSTLRNVLDGSPELQTEAFWVYLSDGKKAPIPSGVGGKKSIPLVPETETIIYRNFIDGAGPRAIAVGYPEKVSLAFDANDLRIAMIWHGAFMDAGRHWTDRGTGFEGPLGDNILHLPAGPSFATLAKADAPWPKESAKSIGEHFRGYKLTPDERPTFLYAIGDIAVTDTPAPVKVGKDVGLKRTIELTAAKDVSDLYYRAAVGSKIVELGNGVFTIDGALKMTLTSAKPAVVRSAAGKMELLVPVEFKDSKSRIVQEYAW
jgi:mono/diheme cytochrome c family protein